MVLSIIRFVLRKFLRMILILVGVTLITFLLMHLIPGNPWSNYSSSPRALTSGASDKAFQVALERRFGLDLPLWRQFTRYVAGDFDKDGNFLCGAVCGNLGPSIRQRGRTVSEVLFEPPDGMSFWKSRFGYSIRLVLFGALIAVGLGVPLGIVSAGKTKTAAGGLISVLLAALIAIPNFVLGLFAIIVLASWLHIMRVLPDWNTPSHWIVPAFVLGLMPMANIARVTQVSLMNVLNEDYVRAARAKGLTQRRVMLHHVLRNALAPILTFIGPSLVEMITGLLVVENLFAFPGFGREYWEAVLYLDYPLVLGLTLIYALAILLVTGLVEILGVVLDPRIRFYKQQGASL